MTLRPLTRDEVRSIDVLASETLGIPTLLLMENAGRGAAAWLKDQLGEGEAILVLCGPGNNGGDGAVVARHLDSWGFDVRVAWFVEPGRLRGDAAIQQGILTRSGFSQIHVDETSLADFDWSAGWIVDGLLGTGLTRPVEGLLSAAIDAMNRSGRPVLALDVPSGLDVDTGRPLGRAVRAKATVTFVARKVGFLKPEAAEFLGEVVVVDIGVPRCLFASFLGRM